MFSVGLLRDARPLKVKAGMMSRPDGNTPSSAGRPYCHAFAGASCYFLPKLC
jgi:hypothetical protein